MLLRLLLLVVTELLEGFKRLVSTQEDLDLVEKEQPHTGTIDFEIIMVFRFFCR
jgi:hypothetical protein